jgi:hypothetical protein
LNFYLSLELFLAKTNLYYFRILKTQKIRSIKLSSFLNHVLHPTARITRIFYHKNIFQLSMKMNIQMWTNKFPFLYPSVCRIDSVLHILPTSFRVHFYKLSVNFYPLFLCDIFVACFRARKIFCISLYHNKIYSWFYYVFQFKWE